MNDESASLGTITWQDAVAGARAWRLWSKFAWHDLLSRYRHSWIGPLWLGLSTAIFLAGVSLIYGTLFQQPMSEYVPFVAIGIACWGYMAASVTEAAVTFIEWEILHTSRRASLFVYVYRVFWRNVLVFLHQFAIALIVLLAFGKLGDVIFSATLLGLLILLLQALWAIPLLGLIGAYFSDVQPIISSLFTSLDLRNTGDLVPERARIPEVDRRHQSPEQPDFGRQGSDVGRDACSRKLHLCGLHNPRRISWHRPTVRPLSQSPGLLVVIHGPNTSESLDG